jgi:hypothetical protein
LAEGRYSKTEQKLSKLTPRKDSITPFVGFDLPKPVFQPTQHERYDWVNELIKMPFAKYQAIHKERRFTISAEQVAEYKRLQSTTVDWREITYNPMRSL